MRCIPPLEAPEEDLAYIDSKMATGDEPEGFEKVRYRAAMLLALDRAIGRINSKLKELGLEENTLVIFTNDNGDYGPYNRETVFSGGKGNALEGGIRVPFIMKWPGKIQEGRVYDGITSTLDILPTAVVAGNGSIEPEWNIHGVDLMPCLRNEKKGDPHDWLFWRMGGTKAARNGKWKLFYNGYSGYGGYGVPEDQARWFLFNLETDPSEKHDLSKVFPGVFEEMQKQYRQWESEQPAPCGHSELQDKWVNGRKNKQNKINPRNQNFS